MSGPDKAWRALLRLEPDDELPKDDPDDPWAHNPRRCQKCTGHRWLHPTVVALVAAKEAYLAHRRKAKREARTEEGWDNHYQRAER